MSLFIKLYLKTYLNPKLKDTYFPLKCEQTLELTVWNSLDS